MAEVGVVNEIDVILIPAFTAIPALAEALEKNPVARLDAQNMHWEKCGALTGEISAPMLAALYVNCVVLGHSKRRRLFGETDEMVNRKIITALSGLNISHSRRVGRESFFNSARRFDFGHVPRVGSSAKSRLKANRVAVWLESVRNT